MFVCYNNKELCKMDWRSKYMPNLMETFIAEYGSSNDLRAVKSPLRICPIGAHSDYQGGRVTGMTLDASVDTVYTHVRIIMFKFKA